jgi:hypothetical protein
MIQNITLSFVVTSHQRCSPLSPPISSSQSHNSELEPPKPENQVKLDIILSNLPRDENVRNENEVIQSCVP